MSAPNQNEYVTAWIANQLFGVPIGRVHDVFEAERVTPVPLAPPEVAGVLNLRGRVITAIDMRRRLGMPPRTESGPRMAVGIDLGGEAYGLLIDRMGEVLKLPPSSVEQKPINLDRGWAAVTSSIHRLDDGLLLVLDVDRVLDLQSATLAA